uniref:Uncharacterized protein n=1 Tax=Kalanchoe fedtschenkoi TaxID=63787 RepID=A0A7N0TMC1_KALFE
MNWKLLTQPAEICRHQKTASKQPKPPTDPNMRFWNQISFLRNMIRSAFQHSHCLLPLNHPIAYPHTGTASSNQEVQPRKATSC